RDDSSCFLGGTAWDFFHMLQSGLGNNRDKTEQALIAHRASSTEIDRQLPVGGEIFLDHVGHFVRDAEAASRALARAGFAPTPQSIQVNPDPAGGAPLPTGTGNITAMLPRGYVEVLFKAAETPLGQEFDSGLERYAGVPLAAF